MPANTSADTKSASVSPGLAPSLGTTTCASSSTASQHLVCQSASARPHFAVASALSRMGSPSTKASTKSFLCATVMPTASRATSLAPMSLPGPTRPRRIKGGRAARLGLHGRERPNGMGPELCASSRQRAVLRLASDGLQCEYEAPADDLRAGLGRRAGEEDAPAMPRRQGGDRRLRNRRHPPSPPCVGDALLFGPPRLLPRWPRRSVGLHP